MSKPHAVTVSGVHAFPSRGRRTAGNPALRLVSIVLLGAALGSGTQTTVPLPATFPHAEAETADGIHVVFPEYVAGRPAVFVISLSRASSDNLRRVGTEITHAVGARAPVFSVVAAEGMPFFVKGWVRREIRRQAPPPPPGAHSNVLLTFKNAGWSNVVAPGDEREPGVVVIDAGGNVVFDERSGPDDTIVDRTLHALAAAPTEPAAAPSR